MLSDERFKDLAARAVHDQRRRNAVEIVLRLAVAETAEARRAELAAAHEARDQAKADLASREQDAWRAGYDFAKLHLYDIPLRHSGEMYSFLAGVEKERDALRAEVERLRKESDALADMNHGQFLELEYLRRVERAANALYAESEEHDFDDGLGQGAPQQYWDALADAFEPQTEAIDAAIDATRKE